MLQSGHLDRVGPEQLARLYEETAQHDTGAAWRDLSVLRRLRQLRWLGLLPRRGSGLRVLDFGSGSAFVASILRFHFGATTVAFAPLGRKPTYRVDHVAREWNDVAERAPYELVLATEVLEHLRSPGEDLARLAAMLAPDATIYVTTGLYRPDVHGPEWSYLAPESGLHVCFYAGPTIQLAATAAGCGLALCVGAEFEWVWVRGAMAQSALARARARTAAAALRGLVGAGFLSRIQ
jgi:hypothetical protein